MSYLRLSVGEMKLLLLLSGIVKEINQILSMNLTELRFVKLLCRLVLVDIHVSSV